MNRDLSEIKQLLDQKVGEFNTVEFIVHDPVSVPHLFSLKEDIEISAFLTATLAWGQRTTIIRNARLLMSLMDFSPYDFILHCNTADKKLFRNFIHRTFNGEDCQFFLDSLQNIYLHHDGLEASFSAGLEKTDTRQRISAFRTLFFSISHPERSGKHVSDPARGSAAKRLNMFLRWMVRNDEKGVDFGIWKSFSPADLYCPLDVHSGAVARELGLLRRKQNDWQAVEELTSVLRLFDPEDPVKYDYALFGLGVYKDTLRWLHANTSIERIKNPIATRKVPVKSIIS